MYPQKTFFSAQILFAMGQSKSKKFLITREKKKEEKKSKNFTTEVGNQNRDQREAHPSSSAKP